VAEADFESGRRAATAADEPRLRPLRHRQSAGQSTSLWQAVALANGTWIATIDGDGQNDPADIPRLLARAGQGDVALVAGRREKRRDDWLKRLSSRLANGVRSYLLGDGTPDTGCGLKVMRRDAFLALPYFDHMHRFLPALVQMQGGASVTVAVGHRPRLAGRSHYGVNDRLWAGLVDLLGVMWLRRRCRLPAPILQAELEPVHPQANGSILRSGCAGRGSRREDFSAPPGVPREFVEGEGA
jgi:dolichol-phosphate mannosyltransferase